VEGPTDDPAIRRLRLQQMKNALLILLTSRGIPMLRGGDEAAQTQKGNNNGYCHDSELTWFDWSLVQANAELHAFVQELIALRRAHPVLRAADHPTALDLVGCGDPEVSWHGRHPGEPDWSPEARELGVLWCGRQPDGIGPDYVYVALNADSAELDVELPTLPPGLRWQAAIDTSVHSADGDAAGARGARLADGAYSLAPRSAIVLLGTSI
jgi:glycogen operon protein